ncbi:MAG: hypothetical protein R6W94_01230 [Spirochaetia bacterium]
MNFVSDITSNELTVDVLGGWLADFGTDLVVWDPRQLSRLEEFIVVSLIKSPQVRVGLFDVGYRRPTAFGNDITVDDGIDTSAAFAVDYNAQGHIIGFRRARRDIDGSNMDLACRRSTRSEIDAYYVPAGEAGLQVTDVRGSVFNPPSGIAARLMEPLEPVPGGNVRFQKDPRSRDNIPFYEYFHGDNGAGIGASHRTGWAALVATLLQQSS